MEAGSAAGTVLVRDTKNRAAPALTFGPAAWRVFVTALGSRPAAITRA